MKGNFIKGVISCRLRETQKYIEDTIYERDDKRLMGYNTARGDCLDVRGRVMLILSSSPEVDILISGYKWHIK